MKIFKKFFALIFIGFFLLIISCKEEKIPNDIFTYFSVNMVSYVTRVQEYMGVITDGRVQFYGYDFSFDRGWRIYSKMDMALPEGYSDVVICNYEYLGVIINDKIQFYKYRGDTWEVAPEREMSLPKGCKSVFVIGIEKEMGLVVNDKVQFYQFNDYNNTWEVIPGGEMSLPRGYKGVLGDGGSIQVITNDGIQFYEYDGDNASWIGSHNLSNMILPKEHKGVFLFDKRYIGVKINDKIEFYDYDGSAKLWKVNPPIDFIRNKEYQDISW